MKVDSRLCQPAGTPIFVQTGRRLGVTFVVNVEADVLRPIHISVERIPVVVFLAHTHVQATFDTLTVVFPPADTTRFARVALRHFSDFDAFEFGFVFKDVREPVECPPVQVKIAVLAPVFRVTVVVFADTNEIPDVDAPNILFDASLDDVFREVMEEVSAAL